MGKNTNKPVHKSQLNRGAGGGGEEEEGARAFHSKEYEQAQLEQLLAGSQRPTWDEFKEQQRKKGELEGAEAREEEEAQRRFRAELDEARNARLGAAGAVAEAGAKKKKHKHKHKHKKDRDKDKKKKRRRDSNSDDSDSDSDSSGSRKKKKKHKHKSEKKESTSKADGPVSLKAFFAEDSSDNDS
mmetsp:Transcript_31336/g.81861  ORF Transcript_31336/g.81861 Transcript_31336/m.81861 type:complete len:185 (-) Transcript_31336:248-802(-)|eukprot:CAMPEP_0115850466 /NCGR_PEP_ID=MMETSP0287-20121206/11978_1 /TAXON_ID=412157 /ORGANISM="Chrysochromulina rotalis, Strain UIO044" /LENGTH=184 /DNA_ID=CAMNT_0003304463 /DNA_START=42 /DNA_END=596 /DNA_ORIENTATION=+